MNRQNDRWTDKVIPKHPPAIFFFFQGEKESIVKQRNFKIPEGIRVWKMCDFESI